MKHITSKSIFAALIIFGGIEVAHAAGGGISTPEGMNQMRRYSADVRPPNPAEQPSSWTNDSHLEQPAISPNGIPTLSDFAARR